jgi:hypothetical protein
MLRGYWNARHDLSQYRDLKKSPGNQWHNRPMILSAVDLGIEIDSGPDQPGAILQYRDKGYWYDYLVDGKPVTNPFDVETLPRGRYRLRVS